MNKVAIIYWPKGGSVEKSAKKLHTAYGAENADIFDIDTFSIDLIEKYSNIIFGNSTVGFDAWQYADADNKWGPFFSNIEKSGIKLSGKKVAIFGLGDQMIYPANFVDGIGAVKNEAERLGAKIVGEWSTEGYTYTDSEGENKDGDKFFGLALDEENQPELTDERIFEWVKILKSEF